MCYVFGLVFFFEPAAPQSSALSLHPALPISSSGRCASSGPRTFRAGGRGLPKPSATGSTFTSRMTGHAIDTNGATTAGISHGLRPTRLRCPRAARASFPCGSPRIPFLGTRTEWQRHCTRAPRAAPSLGASARTSARWVVSTLRGKAIRARVSSRAKATSHVSTGSRAGRITEAPVSLSAPAAAEVPPQTVWGR